MGTMQREEAGSDLKLYVDMLSQPCRAVAIFCRVNGINAEEVIVSILRGETRTPEFRNAVVAIEAQSRFPAVKKVEISLLWLISLLHKRQELMAPKTSTSSTLHLSVPRDPHVLCSLSLKFDSILAVARRYWRRAVNISLLWCSHTILRYLATTRDVADHWYPKDVKRRALIDNALDWHHLNLRKNALTLTLQKVATLPDMPAGIFPGPDESVRAEAEKQLKKILEQLETVFLQEPGKFLANGEQVSIADLSLVCELKQLVLLSKKEEMDLLGPWKKVTAWMDAVEEATNPHFSRVTAPILAVAHDKLSFNRLYMEIGV